MDPFSIALLLGAGASILSGFMGSNAAQQASSTQAAAADKATALQAATIAQARADAAPWLQAGQQALQQYTGELGLTKTVTNPTTGATTPFQSQFSATPNYAFDVQQGTKGVINNLAALGLKQSGAGEKALGSYLTGKANDTYQSYLDRLSGVSTGGQTTEGQTSNLAANSALGQSNSIMNSGAATASGYVGSANALGAGLTGAASGVATGLGYKNGYGSPTSAWGINF